MVSIIVLGIAALLLHETARAVPIYDQNLVNGICQRFTLPITATAAGADYGIARINDDIDASAWAINHDTWSTVQGLMSVVRNTTIGGTYNIHAQLCTPKVSARSNILQIATHGLFYDSRYWEPKLAETPSYVDATLAAGYSILTYDRLGVGQSDKPEAYLNVQAGLELEILHQITMIARNGSLSAYMNGEVPSFDKIVHVGHSFGSVYSYAYMSTHGNMSDGAILTGFVPNKYLASAGTITFDASVAADRPNGYLSASRGGIQNIFFGGNDSFTDEAMYYADSLRQAFPVGEYASSYALLLNQPDGAFKGPLQFMLPEFDFYICKGDCKGVYNETALRQSFPGAKELEIYVQPNTGHAMPFHKNATAGYEVIFDFLRRNGL